MPVILHPRDYDCRLDDYDETRPPVDLLRPYESEGMRMTLANRLVGNVRNNDPEMLDRALLQKFEGKMRLRESAIEMAEFKRMRVPTAAWPR